jgi:hypothetical protein
MKIFKYFLIPSLFLLASCDFFNSLPECVSGDKQYYDTLAQQSINCYDSYGNAFAVMIVREDIYKTCSDNMYVLNGYTENVITFRNTSNRTVSFDFTVTQHKNGYYRQYQEYVSRLKPNQTVVFNAGNNMFYDLRGSYIEVRMYQIWYE